VSATPVLGCLFCAVRDRRSPARFAFEDDRLFAIEDLVPQAPVHLLVIPRAHVRTLNDLTAADAPLVGHMLEVAAGLARERGVADSGWRAVMNCNRDGHQTVFHIHLHLLGGRPMQWPPG
jgi:histidine triad (HIT) family protein